MPFGAIFTSSAGGDIGGGRLRTRFRGPILAGYASTGDPGGQTLGALSSAVAGSAAAPVYSFYVRPDAGLYAANVTSSASDIRFAQAGADVIQVTSAQTQLNLGSGGGAGVIVSSVGLLSGSTAGATNPASFVWASTAFLSTAATEGYIYIPQTTFAVSSSGGTSSGPTPTARNTGAAIIFDSARNKLSVFSTVANQWLSVTLSSS